MHRFVLVAVAVALFDSGPARAQSLCGPKEQLVLTRAQLLRVEAQLELAVAQARVVDDARVAAYVTALEQQRDAMRVRDAARARYAESVAVARATETAVRALEAARANAATKEQKNALAAAAGALEAHARAKEGAARTAYRTAVTKYALEMQLIDAMVREMQSNAERANAHITNLSDQRDALNARTRKLTKIIADKM
jgi:hypothetical protein